MADSNPANVMYDHVWDQTSFSIHDQLPLAGEGPI